jgi:hypothetical protein
LIDITTLIYGLIGALGVLSFLAVLRYRSRKTSSVDASKSEQSPDLAEALPFQGFARSDFKTVQIQGDYGEALTLLAMTVRGYRSLNGKINKAGHGIDGIFLKDDTNRSWSAVLVETKTGQSPYQDKQMRDAKLLDNLDSLFVLSGSKAEQVAYSAIASSIREKSAHVQKELWRHNLESGQCLAVTLNADGAKTGRTRDMDLRALGEGLSLAMRQIDQHESYFKIGGNSEPESTE